MASHQTLFYATHSDLMLILPAFEATRPLDYTLISMRETPDLVSYSSCADIPALGVADHPTAVANPGYLVADRGTTIRVRDVPQLARGIRYAIDPQINTATIDFSAGGRYGDDVLLYGSIGTVWATDDSLGLYRPLRRLFLKTFRRYDILLIGPEADRLWRAGARLTESAESPPEFDMKPSEFEQDATMSG